MYSFFGPYAYERKKWPYGQRTSYGQRVAVALFCRLFGIAPLSWYKVC